MTEKEEFIVLKEWEGRPLQSVLSIALEISRGTAKALLDSKSIFVNNRRIWMAKHAVHGGDRIEVRRSAYKEKPKVSKAEIEVLHMDSDIIIVNKPAGFVSNEHKESVESYLQKKFKTQSICAVHRLDKHTSGCLLFAMTKEVKTKCVTSFTKKQVEKVYHALVVGKFHGVPKVIETPIDGKSARSMLRLLKASDYCSLLEVTIETGRTHQIRKHLLSIGFPILGDKDYVTRRSSSAEYRDVPRQMLHAQKLSFDHPITTKKIAVTAKYPEDFERILKGIK